MLQEGQPAPAFTLPSSTGDALSLKDLKGKNVVLYFYPKDDTPGCTIEAREFSEAKSKFAALNTTVIGVSKDSINSHCKFRDKYGLSIPLLSDADGKVIHAYGAWGTKNMYGRATKGILRTTVLIDPKGRVKKVFPKVRVDGHVDAVLAAVKGASENAAKTSGGGTKSSKAKAKAGKSTARSSKTKTAARPVLKTSGKKPAARKAAPAKKTKTAAKRKR